MSDDKDKKSRRLIDKIIMGAVVGGAIGSVMGLTVAPKKGSETRKDVAEAAKKVKGFSLPLLYKLRSWIKKEKKIPNEMEKD